MLRFPSHSSRVIIHPRKGTETIDARFANKIDFATLVIIHPRKGTETMVYSLGTI